jgi:hypothetical protein
MACDTAKHEGEKPPPSLLHSRLIRNVERKGVVNVENCKKKKLPSQGLSGNAITNPTGKRFETYKHKRTCVALVLAVLAFKFLG